MSTRPVLPPRIFAFGPFGDHHLNPSSVLAGSLFTSVEVLDVSFVAVDLAIQRLRTDDWDCVIAFGVHGTSKNVLLEKVARNTIGEHADVCGVKRNGEKIHKDGAETLVSRLWGSSLFEDGRAGWRMSDNAGDYLCNYFCYQLLDHFPHKLTGFVHVPTFEKLDMGKQQIIIRQLFTRISVVLDGL